MNLSEIGFGTGLVQFRSFVDIPDIGFGSLVRLAKVAEKLGFDLVCMPDHAHFPYEALTVLGAVATKTKKIRLVTCVLDLNRRNPATVAQMVATLDKVSGGRFIFGVGRGTWNEKSYGLPVDKPVSRMRESIEIIKMSWTRPVLNYEGKFYRFDNASSSKTIQKPHPPIWIAAFGPRMKRITAELGDGFITQNISPNMFREDHQEVMNQARRVGRDPEKIQGVYAAIMSISNNHNEAQESIEALARGFLYRYSGPPWNYAKRLGYEGSWNRPEDVPVEAIEKCYIFGTPDECIEKIERYVKAGANCFVAIIFLPEGEKSARLFAERVIPYFRERQF